MRAALLRAFEKPFVVEDIEFLDPAPDRVLVRTHATPFCSTDCLSQAGQLGKVPPTILGHSSVGEIVELGSAVTGFSVGQRVIVPGTPECGRCFYCGAGRPDQCSELFDIAGIYPHVANGRGGEPISAAGNVGGYSELMNISRNQIFHVPTDLPSEVLSLLGCGVTTGFGMVFNVARVRPGEVVAVVGCGHLGLWSIQAARLAGASRIVAVEPRPGRRAVAAEVGATDVVDPHTEDAVEIVKDLTEGRGADHVIEASGAPDAQRLALLLSRRAGTVVYSGLTAAGTEVTLPQIPLTVQSRSVLSTQNGNVHMRRDLPRCVDLLERGLLDAAPIITARYQLDDINDALAASRSLEDLCGVIVLS